jgi:hypothetical protein
MRRGRPRKTDVIRSANGKSRGDIIDQSMRLKNGKFSDFVEGYVRFAVYVMSPIAEGRPVKIGVSCDPLKRLSHLQIGAWKELSLEGVVWCSGPCEAFALESRAHKMLEQDGKELIGEWFNVSAPEASEVIRFAADVLGVELFDEQVRLDKVQQITEIPA